MRLLSPVFAFYVKLYQFQKPVIGLFYNVFQATVGALYNLFHDRVAGEVKNSTTVYTVHRHFVSLTPLHSKGTMRLFNADIVII